MLGEQRLSSARRGEHLQLGVGSVGDKCFTVVVGLLFISITTNDFSRYTYTNVTSTWLR